MIIHSTSNVSFEITGWDSENPFYNDGIVSIYRASRVRDGMPCIIKRFDMQPDRGNSELLKRARISAETLCGSPILDVVTNKISETIIAPLNKDSFFMFEDGAFAYAAEFIDTNQFVNIDEFRSKVNNVQVVCKAMKNYALAMRSIHLAGFCYNDISDGSIYLDFKTGDVRIIGCDNINMPNQKIISGVTGFIAPEVYTTRLTDMDSDNFATAVVLYRIFTGAHPLLGKRVVEYLNKKQGGILDQAPVIYGSNALFVFDPNDNSNSILGYTDTTYRDYFESEIAYWDTLPEPLQRAFIKTFSEGIKPENKSKRTSNREWADLADLLISTYTTKCEACGQYSFSDKPSKQKRCWFCNALMPFVSAKRLSAMNKRLRVAVISVKSNNGDVHELKIGAGQQMMKSVHDRIPELSEPGWMQVHYHEGLNILIAKNNTDLSWQYTIPGRSSGSCEKGEFIPLIRGTKININGDMLEMVVTGLE